MSNVTQLPWLEELTKLLGREPETERTKDGDYVAVYFGTGGPFVDSSIEGALRKLHDHLTGKDSPSIA